MPIAVTIGIIGAIAALFLTGLAQDAWEVLIDAKIPPLILVLLLGVTLPIVHALRWRIVIRALDEDVSPIQAADITVSSALLNYSSPGFVGASAKAVLAKKSSNVAYQHAAVSIGFEHSLDLLILVIGSLVAVLLLGPATFFVNFSLDGKIGAIVIGVALTALIIAIAVFVILKTRLRQTVGRLLRSIEQIGRKAEWPKVITLTILYWLIQVAIVALLFWALSIPVGLGDILAVATIPVLAGMLVPIPGGLGIREAVTVALTAATVASAADLLSLAILQRVLLMAALPLALVAIRGARLIVNRTRFANASNGE